MRLKHYEEMNYIQTKKRTVNDKKCTIKCRMSGEKHSFTMYISIILFYKFWVKFIKSLIFVITKQFIGQKT